MYRAALVAILLVAGVAVAHAQNDKNPLVEIGKSPLLLYVARGGENACGLGCNEWIAVEGFFDSDSSARFRRFVSRLGRRDLPIFFNSPGGLAQQAMAIGRLMRDRGMTAGVAKTIPETCLGANLRACESSKKSGKELSAEWSSIGAQCNSACVYAFLGARVRLVSPGSRLGVHASKNICMASNGAVLDEKDPRCPKLDMKSELSRYARQMGVDPALVEAAHKVPHENFRFLSGDEIVSYGIARGEVQETTWIILRGGWQRSLKFIKSAADPRGELGWSDAIMFECVNKDDLLLSYLQRVARQGERGRTAIVTAVIGNREFVLKSEGSTSNDEIGYGSWFDQYRTRLPVSLLDAAPLHLKIELRNSRVPEDVRNVVVQPSMSGFHRAWNIVSSSCAS
jgi:hypothetical protein